MPSQQAVRCDHTMVTTNAATVIDSPASCFTATKVDSGRYISRKKLEGRGRQADARQRIGRLRKSDTTRGFSAISGAMGQTSPAGDR